MPSASRVILALLCASLASATSGTVAYSGTVRGTAGGFNSTVVANVFDRDLSTEWISPDSSGDVAIVDFGVGNSVQLTAWRLAAGFSGYAGQITRMSGLAMSWSDDASTCAQTGGVTWSAAVDTTTVLPYYARYTQTSTGGVGASGVIARNERSLSGLVLAAHRCYRVVATTTYFHVSEIVLIGTAGAAGVSSRPMMPVISPGAGAYPTTSPTITITSPTTSAAIHYTTDGSTPTCSSTLYSAPFVLTVGTSTVVQALACDAGTTTQASDITIGHFRNYTYKPADDWYDDDGVLIQAHAGDITFYNGRYYMVGQFSNKGEDGAGPDIGANEGVWLYSSADLVNWHFESQILDNGQSAGTSWFFVERPHLRYRAATKDFVLWTHMANSHNGTDRAGIATASTITGPWTWQTVTYDPANGVGTVGMGDYNLFIDTDGTGYIVRVRGDQAVIYIQQLTANYQATTGSPVTIDSTASHEAPTLFKRNAVYFVIESAQSYYASDTAAQGLVYTVCTCSTPLGSWPGTFASIWASAPTAGQPYNGQSSSMMSWISGRQDSFLLLTDYWLSTNLYGSRASWAPLTFPTSTTLQASQPASWDPSTFAPTGASVAGKSLGIGVSH